MGKSAFYLLLAVSMLSIEGCAYGYYVATGGASGHVERTLGKAQQNQADADNEYARKVLAERAKQTDSDNEYAKKVLAERAKQKACKETPESDTCKSTN